MAHELTAEQFMSDPTGLGKELELQGALTFEPGPTGLFSAAYLDEDMGAKTGMNMAWLRDNAHIASALANRGRQRDIEIALAISGALLAVLEAHEDVLDTATADPQSPRLPVRVDAYTLKADVEPRVQHDSVGYALWITSKLMQQYRQQPSRDEIRIMAKTAGYLQAVRYWESADDGHWEEDRQLHTSSIGVAVAGLQAWFKLADKNGYNMSSDVVTAIRQGHRALAQALPHETRETDTYAGRLYDSSHLFLVETLRLFDGPSTVAQQIVDAIEREHVRDIGTIRYKGDTYYAPGSEDMLGIGKLTSYAPGRLERRNMLAKEAEKTASEAQWTLFDPLLSAYHGRRYREDRRPADYLRQPQYLNRALAQLVDISGQGLRLPELYRLKTPLSEWRANPHIPLIWSQANMLIALGEFESVNL